MKKDRAKYTLTPKGRALVIAAETGLIEKAADGTLDAEKFEAFWNRVEAEIMTRAVLEEANRLNREWEQGDGLGTRIKDVLTWTIPAFAVAMLAMVVCALLAAGLAFIVKRI